MTLAAARPTRTSWIEPASLGAGLVLVAFNLRTTVSSLPPLLSQVRTDVPMSSAVAGLLTALPVLCMAFLAPLASRASVRFGAVRTTTVSVLLIGAGNGLRGLGSTSLALLGATLVAGAGVAILGIVVPAVVKSVFHHRQGLATGAYTVAMMGGSAVAALMSNPLGAWLGSWREALSAWAVPALVAVVLWLLLLPALHHRVSLVSASSRPHRLPWSSRPAWLLSLYMTAQSSLAYAMIAWLAPAYVERGWSPAAAGALLGVSTLASLLSTLVLPALADTVIEFRLLTSIAICLTAVGVGWLWLAPEIAPWGAVVVFGLGSGAGFSLGLTRIVHYAHDGQASSSLTAMVFLISYGIAATVPVLMGLARDATGSFSVPFAVMTVIAVSQLVLATRLSGRYRGTVE